ncbi:MAG TPA: hypothetical protein VN841_00795 [Bryobacteraceae bacterium]|nr:hypothetical protein [Bryobacteraceae bacterium]
MRRDSDYFGEKDLELVYIAKKLNEAQRLEDLLTESGLDYLVEPDKYMGGVILRRELVGAFFYVDPINANLARETMMRSGFAPYLTGPAD